MNEIRREIHCRMAITSGKSNFELCEMVEQTLLSSVLGSSVFNLDVLETTVKKIYDNTADASSNSDGHQQTNFPTISDS